MLYLETNKTLSNNFKNTFLQLLPQNKNNKQMIIFDMITETIENNNIEIYQKFISEIKRIIPTIWKDRNFQKQIILKYNLNKTNKTYHLLSSLNIKDNELIVNIYNCRILFKFQVMLIIYQKK